MPNWRLIPLHIGDTEHHMALARVLVNNIGPAGPALWWHATNSTGVLAGAGTSMRVLRQEAPLAIRMVKRPTGGGMVLVGPGTLGLDVVLPESSELLTGDIVEDYRWLGEVWQAALRLLNIDSSVLTIETARRWSSRDAPELRVRACFGSYSPYEVVVGTRKIVGLSQVRRKRAVLFSSAVHVERAPAELVTALPLLTADRRRLGVQLQRRAASLNEVSGYPVTIQDVIQAFHRSLRKTVGVGLRQQRWSRNELVLAHTALAADARRARR